MKMQPESEKVLSSRELSEFNGNIILHLYRTLSIIALHLVKANAARQHRLIPYCLRLLSNNLCSDRAYITRFNNECSASCIYFRWEKNNPASKAGFENEIIPSNYITNEYLKNGSVVFIGCNSEVDVAVKNDSRLRIFPGTYGEIHIPIQNKRKLIGILSFDKMNRRITPTFQIVHPMRIAALLLADILILNLEKEKSCEGQSGGQGTYRELKKIQEIQTLQQMVNVKNKLISTVSHELRTPLTGMIGLTQALRMSNLALTEKEKDTFLGIIENEGKRLAALICDLLDLSVTEMDGMKLSLSKFSLNELISEVMILVDNSSGEKDITAKLKEDVILNADKDRIKQVLIILLDNALKHGGKQCTISTFKKNDMKRVVVGVNDNGPGILVNNQEKIFESFYTTGSIKKNQPKCIGLGLAIAKKIIESHGGTIRVESVPGNGCTFLFELDINENIDHDMSSAKC